MAAESSVLGKKAGKRMASWCTEAGQKWCGSTAWAQQRCQPPHAAGCQLAPPPAVAHLLEEVRGLHVDTHGGKHDGKGLRLALGVAMLHQACGAGDASRHGDSLKRLSKASSHP